MRKLPTKQKEMQGTLEKSRVKENEIEYSEAQDIYTPATFQTADEQFNQDATNHWMLFTDELKKVGILYATDLHELELLCYWIAVCKKCMREMGNPVIQHENNKGKTNSIVSSYVKALSMATDQVNKLSAKFGFSPVDKTKIETGKKKETNPFDEL